MSTNMDRAADALFPENKSIETGNVKFFLGTSRAVTAEQLAGQLNRADAQIRAGIATPSNTLDGALPIKRLGD